MRSPHWRQNTPKMQAVSVVSSIEGALLNIEDGHDPKRVLSYLLPMLEDLKLLHRAVMPDHWTPNSEADPEDLTKFLDDLRPHVKRLTGKDLEVLEAAGAIR